MCLGCTVAELLDRVSSEELAEWQAYYKLEPFGPMVSHVMVAQLTQLMANVNRQRNSEPYKLADFLPVKKEPVSGKAFRKRMEAANKHRLRDGKTK